MLPKRTFTNPWQLIKQVFGVLVELDLGVRFNEPVPVLSITVSTSSVTSVNSFINSTI